MGLTWTLVVGTEPIYAIAPAGSHAPDVNARLVALLGQQQLRGDYCVERVSLPGRLTGRDVRLLSGETVPEVEVVAPRGLHGWSVAQIVASAAAQVGAPWAYDEALREALREYLARLYFDMANPGRTPAQRALNFAGDQRDSSRRAASSTRCATASSSTRSTRAPASPAGRARSAGTCGSRSPIPRTAGAPAMCAASRSTSATPCRWP